jgi:hypothetical protein
MSVGGLDLMERLDRQGSLSIADQDVARENRSRDRPHHPGEVGPISVI